MTTNPKISAQLLLTGYEPPNALPFLGSPEVYAGRPGVSSILEMTKINKSPPQTYDVGRVYTLKDEISTDQIILIQNGSILITLELKILIPEEWEGGFDLIYDKFQSWVKPGLVISCIYEEGRNGYVIWSDLSTMTSRLFSETSEDAEVTVFSNGLLISGGEFPKNTAYEIPSGIGHPMAKEAREINIVGVTETLHEWARDDQFFWFDYMGAIGRTGKIDNGHLKWTDDDTDTDYDYDMEKNEIKTLKNGKQVFSMETIFSQSESWLGEILQSNGLERSNYLAERLSAIILTHNAGMIQDSDISYIRRPDFAKYMMMSDDQLNDKRLETFFCNIEINTKFNKDLRLNVIRALLS